MVNSLREATERAVQRRVFGVPSFGIDEHVISGSDPIDFAAAYLVDPSVLATAEIKRADALPIGVTRSESHCDRRSSGYAAAVVKNCPICPRELGCPCLASPEGQALDNPQGRKPRSVLMRIT